MARAMREKRFAIISRAAPGGLPDEQLGETNVVLAHLVARAILEEKLRTASQLRMLVRDGSPDVDQLSPICSPESD